MTVPLIEATDVTLRYSDGRREIVALDGVSLRVSRGEMVGLVGPSGSGKSSLLYVLAGLRAPHAGAVRILGQPLPTRADASAAWRRQHVGFLFQEPFLVPYLTIRENACAHVEVEGRGVDLETLAEAMGLAKLLDRRPHQLSGGERQRAGLLRALANAPALVLADEPTASLDSATGRAVMALLRAQCREAGLLVVTHDPRMLDGADRVLHLADGRLR